MESSPRFRDLLACLGLEVEQLHSRNEKLVEQNVQLTALCQRCNLDIQGYEELDASAKLAAEAGLTCTDQWPHLRKADQTDEINGSAKVASEMAIARNDQWPTSLRRSASKTSAPYSLPPATLPAILGASRGGDAAIADVRGIEGTIAACPVVLPGSMPVSPGNRVRPLTPKGSPPRLPTAVAHDDGADDGELPRDLGMGEHADLSTEVLASRFAKSKTTESSSSVWVEQAGPIKSNRSNFGRGAVGQFGRNSTTIFRSKTRGEKTSLEKVVTSNQFEAVSTFLTFLSAMCSAIEVQYNGIDIAYVLRLEGADLQAHEKWPEFITVAEVADIILGCLFTIELILKLYALRRRFFFRDPGATRKTNCSSEASNECSAHLRAGGPQSAVWSWEGVEMRIKRRLKQWGVDEPELWNWLDMFTVLGWLVERALHASENINVITLRIIRVAKIGRIARRIKTIKALDSLQVLIGSIKASMSVLVWAAMFLFICHMLAALALNSMLVEFFECKGLSVEECNDPAMVKKRQEVYIYFGTFTRSMTTTFELTLANGFPIARTIIEHVDERWAIVMLCYKLLFGFAFVAVIRGVFLHETFNVASTDDELMVVQKKRKVDKHRRQMERLFDEADKDDSGAISKEEFQGILKDPKVRTWMSALEIEVNDAEILYRMMKGEDEGQLTLQELINSISRLKGSARSIDVVALMHQVKDLDDLVVEYIEGRDGANENGGGAQSDGGPRLTRRHSRLDAAPKFN